MRSFVNGMCSKLMVCGFSKANKISKLNTVICSFMIIIIQSYNTNNLLIIEYTMKLLRSLAFHSSTYIKKKQMYHIHFLNVVISVYPF